MATSEYQPDDATVGLKAYGDDDEGLGDATRHVITLIRRNLLLIATIIATMIGLAVVVTMLQTPLYTAVTAVQINNQSDQVLGDQLGDNPGEIAPAADTNRFLNSQLEIIKSRSLAIRVAHRLDLFKDDRFPTILDASPLSPDLADSTRRDKIVDYLLEHRAVELPRETRIAQISFNSTDPAYSAKIANAFAEEFIQSNLQRKFDSSAYARKFVAQQMEEARVRLENSERDLNAYAREAGLIRTRSATGATNGGNSTDGGTGSVTAASLAQINEAANAASAAVTTAAAKWKAEAATPMLSSQAVLSNGTIQALLSQKAQLETQLQSQRTRYLPDHPSVKALEAQLASTNTEIRNVASGIRQSIHNEYVAAQESESQLRAQVNTLQNATMSEQDRTVRYNTLAREGDTNRQLYEGLLQRYRELNAAAGISASNVSIIDQAETPRSPSSPNLLKNIVLSIAAGIVLAAIVVFMRDQLDDRIRMPEDVEEKVNLPLLGVIPKETEDELATQLADPKSPLSEAYSSLRGSLMYSTTQGLPHVLLVTSSQQSEGKSTTSYATARALSRVGKRVLLIDADMRRPSIHSRIGLDNAAGLSTLLTSQQSVMSVVRATDDENLSVLTSGPHPPSPSELLASQRMAEVLQELAQNFDSIVIDSPPVLGLADAPVLSAISDGVAFVIEAEGGQRGAVKASLRRLRAMNPVIVGAILTKFDPNKSSNRYSSYYGYEYYRYRSEDTA